LGNRKISNTIIPRQAPGRSQTVTADRSNEPGDLRALRVPNASITQPRWFDHLTALSHFLPIMPLDTSTYNLALLRVDGRRWNELRRVHAQIRTQAAADGSSYLEMGHTKVMCVVTGPSEPGPRRGGIGGGGAGGGGSGAGGGQSKEAEVVVSIVIAGFSSVDRKRRGRGDK
jgi:hypothetical protein